jgi:hypothetical protein
MGAPASMRKAVAAAGTASFYNIPAPATVCVEPGSGGTMTVKVRVHPNSALVDLDADTTAVAAAAVRTLMSPVYEIQFGAATAAGDGSVAF